MSVHQPTEYRDKIIQELKQYRKENKLKFDSLIKKYLNTPFPKFLKGRKNTLASRNWKRGAWYKSNDSLGLCFLSPYKYISFNQAFLNEPGIDDKFEDVLRHEIAHALELEYYGNTEDTNVDPFKRMIKTCKEAFGDEYAHNGKWSTKTDFSIFVNYWIIFEKFAGTPDGAIILRQNIPNDYKTNPGYVYSTIIDLIKYSIVDSRYFDNDNELKTFMKKYNYYDQDIAKLRRIRKKLLQSDIHTEDISFDQMFYIEENYKNYFKGALAGLGILGSTFGGFNNAEAATDNTTAIKQEAKSNIIKITKSSSDLDIIAATIFDEAKGEKTIGRKAVASVIQNRSKWKKYKNNPVNVCIAKLQFSGWNKGYIKIDLKSKEHQKIWKECKEIAKQIIENKFTPITKANHYYNPKLANPKWGKLMKNVEIIGNHKFGVL